MGRWIAIRLPDTTARQPDRPMNRGQGVLQWTSLLPTPPPQNCPNPARPLLHLHLSPRTLGLRGLSACYSFCHHHFKIISSFCLV